MDPGEQAELEAFRDFYRLLEQQRSGRLLEVAGAVCGTVDDLRDVLMVNRVLGLGLERLPTDADLDEIEAFFREAGTRYYVSVRPTEGLSEALEERGYEPGYAWAVFRRDTAPYGAESQLRVEKIDAGAAADFGAVVTEAYGMSKSAAAAITAAVGRPGWQCFVTYEGTEPAGAAAMYVHGRGAWFGFAGTRPEHRRKGSQRALFAARIDSARELGVEVLATETGALAPDRPSNSYRNITRVGFAQIYVRPNYTGSGAGSSSSSGSRPR